ncbi:DNA polymerase III subunit gamma/tau [Reinekea sp.]|jgi:DNA polymerase-3 subunit gamma/tau|uniref:DNA polymerase III subunit gamma/tau n=1 Tax=Reinekea sp. TaxID=1970455 RepID=UPI0039893B77
MSYQVLARKWRPSTFKEMVGQVHVLRALMNALDQQRLHHAYLFTGTRGVGKTTIARLVAKSLNCEEGVSSNPCGVCSACTEIAEGRFVDLIEVDAASRTKVEDTRELLENVQYAPTRGRFKVYLIDEVHMLSTSSFNALLKTLEEPPAHVKFLLATTDPQKLPVTVLSRCLQFNLKNMSREHIVQHLSHILAVEKVGFDDASLWSIAESAQGSMRDALSLTDQAIAFGEGQLKEAEVASMLGTVDLKRVLKLTQLLFEKNIDAIMALVQEVDDHAPDYQALMTELLSTLHRVAIAQAAPAAIDNQKGDRDALLLLAQNSAPEDVHLYYQIAIKAKPEMAMAPSERAGFEMSLLRMLAFSQTPAANIGELPTLTAQPAQLTTVAHENQEASQSQAPKPDTVATAEEPVAAEPEPVPVTEPVIESVAVVDATPSVAIAPSPTVTRADETPPWEETAESTLEAQVPSKIEPKLEEAVAPPVHDTNDVIETKPVSQPVEAIQQLEPSSLLNDSADVILPTQENPATWPETNFDQAPVFWWQVTLHRMGLSGMTKTVFAHSQWQGFAEGTLKITISPNYKKIMNESHCERLLQAIQEWIPQCQYLSYDFGPVEHTPQRWVDEIIYRAKSVAKTELLQDGFVAQLIANYQAELEESSVEPNFSPIPTGA